MKRLSGRSAEERLRIALFGTQLGTWEWDESTGEITGDERYLALHGLTPTTYDGNRRAIVDRVVAEDLGPLREAMAEAARTGTDVRTRYRIRRGGDEAIRWVELHGCLFLDDEGKRIGATGTLRDITEEVERAADLARREERLRLAVGCVGALVWDVDLRARRVLYDAVPAYLGYGPDDLDDRLETLVSIMHEQDRSRVLASHARLAAGAITQDRLEVRLRAKNGSYRWFETIGQVVVRDDAGTPVRLVGASTDVTDRKRVDEALRQQAGVLELVFANIPVAVLLYDADGRFVFANAAMRDLLGYDATELAAPDISERAYPDEKERQAVFEHAKRADGSWKVFRPRAKNGRLVESTWCNVRLPDGRILGFGRDVALENAARAAQSLESLGVMAGGVAHDFNNLLVGILTNASLARDEVLPGTETATLLAEIEDAANRAAELTKQLLAYAGKGRVALEPTDVASLLRELGPRFARDFPSNVELVLDPAPEHLEARLDRSSMGQVLGSLLANAVEALEGRAGTVRVRVSEARLGPAEARRAHLVGPSEARYIAIAVEDEGVGMPPEVLARAFDPFFSTKFAGRGLGLAAALGIARSHHGGIEASSKAGAGSVFTVYLPLHDRATAAAPPRRQPRTGTTVLVVDDEAAVRDAARRVLERRGLRVLLASDGRAGLEVFDAHADEIAVVLVDVTMPAMSGADLAAALRARSEDVELLVMSGYDAEGVAGRFAGIRVTFLQKPFVAQELAEAVARLLPTA